MLKTFNSWKETRQKIRFANLSKIIQKHEFACYLHSSKTDLQVSGEKSGKWTVIAEYPLLLS